MWPEDSPHRSRESKYDNTQFWVGDLVAKEGPWVDLRAWGCRGDGVTDDSVALQAAVDYAESNNRPIYAPVGAYLILTAIDIAQPIHFFGHGMYSLFHGGSTNNIFNLTCKKAIFANFAVQTVVGGGTCIELTQASRNTFFNIYCYRAAGKVFHLKGSLLNSFYNPIITTNAPASPFTTGLAAGIDTAFHLEASGGTGCNGNSIFHPIIEGIDTYGVYIGGASGNNLIKGGTIEVGGVTPGDYGVYIADSKWNTVQSVWFEAFAVACISLDTAAQNSLLDNHCATVEITGNSHRNSIRGGQIATLKIASGCSYNSVQDIAITTLFEDLGGSTYKKAVQDGNTIHLYSPDRDILHLSSIPTTGTWRKGDIIWDAAPIAGTSAGWVCTANGTFSAATDATGDTDGSTAVITGMTDTSDFKTAEYVTVSAGFPSATTPYRIIAKTATTITLDTNSDAAQLNVTVATVDPVFTQMAPLDLQGSDTWDPGSIGNGAEEAKEVTVTGAGLGDFAVASFSLDLQDLELSVAITTSNTATCVLSNNTGGAIDLGSGTIRVKVFQKE